MPGKLNFSSAGVASTTFLAAEVMRQEAKINMVHVPFKGAPEAVTAVVRGDVQFYFAPIPSAQSLGAAGKVQGACGQFRQARAAASGRADRRRGGAAELSNTKPGSA